MVKNKSNKRRDDYDDGARGFIITKEYIESLRKVDRMLKEVAEEEKKSKVEEYRKGEEEVLVLL